MPKRYRQLRVKDLPKVHTWRLLEWDSNLRPSGRKAPNLPLSHHAPPVMVRILLVATQPLNFFPRLPESRSLLTSRKLQLSNVPSARLGEGHQPIHECCVLSHWSCKEIMSSRWPRLIARERS